MFQSTGRLGRTLSIFLVFLLILSILAACGGDDEQEPTEPPKVDPTTTSAPPKPTDAPPTQPPTQAPTQAPSPTAPPIPTTPPADTKGVGGGPLPNEQTYNSPDLAFTVAYPGAWQVDDSEPNEQGVFFYRTDPLTYLWVWRGQFGGEPAQANQAGIESLQEINANLELQDLTYYSEPYPFRLAGLDGLSVDYYYVDDEGVPIGGAFIAITTDAGDTYLLTIEANADAYQDALALIDPMLQSFRVSGAVAQPPGPTPAPPPDRSEEAEWLIMIYADADDNVLERDILIDLNEAERVGSSDQVHIVAQVDRYIGGFSGMGDWTTTKRFYLTQDDDLNTINSPELADLGELNMADGDTLIDFITWALVNYPARKHALIMSDHGAGWPGGYSDPAPGGKGQHDLLLAEYMDDNLWLLEIDESIGLALEQTGLEKLELVGFDACLMSQLEVYVALAPHARYAVASEEVEPGLGWAYTSFLSQLSADPSLDGAGLAQAIVDSFIDQDQRIRDDAARLEFLADFNITEDLDPDFIVSELSYDVTLAGVDLSAVPALAAALDDLVANLVNIDQDVVAEARAYAQSFENVFDSSLPSPYIDLGHFALWLHEKSGDEGVIAAADGLLSALDQAVVAERHGEGKPGAMGIAIHFPTRELYEFGDNLGYTTVANRFADEHQWDDFLYTHFTGDLRASFGQRTTTVLKPIQVAPLTLSSEIAAPDQPVNMQTEITGDRLGFVYSFIGRVLPDEEVLVIEDMDYLFSDETQEIGGVPYPVWSSEGVIIDYDWEPIIYAINDGTTSVRALVAPETYGDVPVYVTEGTYVFANGSEPIYAELYFREGELFQVYGYVGTGDVGAPRQITPQDGDQFVVQEQGIDLKEDVEDDDWSRDGGVLTFGDEIFWIEEIPAPSGSYIVGFIAENLDGETYAQFELLFVENTESSSIEGFAPYASPDLGFAVLYPETWTVEEDIAGETVTFEGDYGVTLAMILRQDFAELADSADEANDMATQIMIEILNEDGDMQDLEYVTEIEDFLLGGFDAKTIDFTFGLDGELFYGSIIVSTPVPDATYTFFILALDADYDVALDHFNPMLQSFDILLSGVSKEQAGPPQPEFDEILGYDDYSDPTSGLEQLSDEWGSAYYADFEQYVFELTPYAGPIYDYYLDWSLPEVFMLEITAGYEGAADNGYGLVFQLMGDGGEFYTFRISGDGFYTVERVEADELVTLIDWTPSDLIDQTELTGNLIAVEGWGDTYFLYINGQMVDSFVDDSYSGGTFGVVVDNFDDTAPVTFYFDDLAVGTPIFEE